MAKITISARELQPGDVFDASLPGIVGYTKTVLSVEQTTYDGDPYIRFTSSDNIAPENIWRGMLPPDRIVEVTRR